MGTPSDRKQFIITRITQRYDPGEDRIALTAQNAEKEVLLLWLTLRLANRLAGTLTGWLDERVKAAAPEHEETPSGIHSFEQWTAQARMRRAPPVERCTTTEEALISEVSLRRGTKGVMLTFRWGTERQARLRLDGTQLRQWLIILYRQYRRADWPKTVWPNWIALGEEERSSRTANYEVN